MIGRSNANIPGENIPLITTGTLYPPDTIAESPETMTREYPIGTLYARMKDMCDSYGLGFRLYRGPDTGKLYRDVYAGRDRTTSQTTLPAVVFSPRLENLSNISKFSSIENYKNVCYVISKNGSQIIYSADADASTSGQDRRVLTVFAEDIELPAG